MARYAKFFFFPTGSVGNGDLQLQNAIPMDSTLRFVTDALNTASPLLLSTSSVTVALLLPTRLSEMKH